MIFVDTGYLNAQTNPNDRLYPRAMAWAAALNEPLLTTEFVRVEVADAFSHPRDRAKCHALLSVLRRSNQCEILPASSELFQSGLQLHAARPDKEWSLTDCISFVIMRAKSRARVGLRSSL